MSTTLLTTNGEAVSKPLKLQPNHREELMKVSGLSEETIREAGIHSEHDKIKLLSMLNRRGKIWNYGSSLIIPYHDSSGAIFLNSVKPDRPPKRNGKVQKYLRPTGQPVRLFVPPKAFRQLKDPTVRLLVTEGEKKALKATQEGFS